MSTPIRSLLVLLGLLCLSQTALALPTDRDQPIHLEADSADINDHTGISVFTGHVILTQGSLHLWADTLTVYHDKDHKADKISRMVAEGAPVRFQEQPKPESKLVTGSARQVDYDVTSGIVVLENDAQLSQGENHFRGPRIEYNRRLDLVKASSQQGQGQRVEITLQPNKRNNVNKGTTPAPAAPVAPTGSGPSASPSPAAPAPASSTPTSSPPATPA
ncbi:MAG TPA: lipopolysaccharide transport periplasmic protein LptA, partial [Gammaproteobacteria bacterium]|nr:lipopolysaccharide transport periplasmic protein LptA [Gammaproteobacteria bacterium]